MKNNQYYWFTLGFMMAILTAMFIISLTEPLEAGYCTPGSQEWCPMYVKVVK